MVMVELFTGEEEVEETRRTFNLKTVCAVGRCFLETGCNRLERVTQSFQTTNITAVLI